MDKIELLKSKIKDLEWAEDYHERKLKEAEFELHLFRTELKSLQ
jgi:hypothetical protein